MSLASRRPAPRLLLLLTLLWLPAVPLPAAPAGPTLQFDYGAGRPLSNPLGQFMYFIPLVSPEVISVHTNVGNTQCARVVSFHCRTNSAAFHAVCEFNFVGAGVQRNVFDHATMIQRHQKELQSGKVLAHQLDSINVEGAGSGTMEIDGVYTNGRAAVIEMRLRFNSHGRASPVTICLEDIRQKDGQLYFENEMVARVSTLTFRQKTPPKMEVALASVKRADAGDGLWQNFIGGLKGAAINLLLPPIGITADGQAAMLDFGLALAMEKKTFTFPFAERLTNGAAITK
jgi:hypothetical protein